jgi:L-asparaginase
VELLYSHANAKAWWLDALLHPAPGQDAVQGLVLAGTGQGTWPKAWADALNLLKAQGVKIWLTSRCALARLPSGTREGWETVPWTPVQARVALMLRLLT